MSCSINSCTHVTPANLSPDEVERIQELMQPGILCLDGFLAKDEEHILSVYEKDNELLRDLKITHYQIGKKLSDLAEMVIQSGQHTLHTDSFTIIMSNEDEGETICPFGSNETVCHKGKRTFTLINHQTTKKFHFSELAIGIIRDHGFFQGKTPYRIDPFEACDALNLLVPFEKP